MVLLLFSDATIVVGFCKDIDGFVFVDTPGPCPCAEPPVGPVVDTMETPPAMVDPAPPFSPRAASSESLSNPRIVVVPAELAVADEEASAATAANSGPDNPSPDPSPPIPIHQGGIATTERGGEVTR